MIALQLLELHGKELEDAVAHESRGEEMHEHLVLGRLHRAKHDTDRALQHLSDALALGMAALDYAVSADAHLELSILHYSTQDMPHCSKHLQRAKDDNDRTGRANVEAAIKFWMGRAAIRETQFSDAIALLREALVQFQAVADQPMASKTCFELAQAHYMLGDRETGSQFFSQVNDQLWGEMEGSLGTRALPSSASATSKNVLAVLG